MALMKCPECTAEISDGALDCPRCGRPLVRVGVRRTRQAWKIIAIVGGVIAIFGLAAIWLDLRTVSLTAFLDDLQGVPSWLVFGGLALNTFGRIGVWWTEV